MMKFVRRNTSAEVDVPLRVLGTASNFVCVGQSQAMFAGLRPTALMKRTEYAFVTNAGGFLPPLSGIAFYRVSTDFKQATADSQNRAICADQARGCRSMAGQPAIRLGSMTGTAEASAPMKAVTFTGAILKLSGLWIASV